MANIAVFPSATAPTTMVVNGRTYTLAVGATPLVVPDFDAYVLEANGWLFYGKDGCGATTARPAANPATGTPAPKVGYEYYDTTLNYIVIFNGSSWVNRLGVAV
jgi:hypothetical protein